MPVSSPVAANAAHSQAQQWPGYCGTPTAAHWIAQLLAPTVPQGSTERFPGSGGQKGGPYP